MRSSPGCRRGSGARPAPRCWAGPRAPRSGSSRAASSLASSPEPPLPGPPRTREETPRGLVSPARRCPRALTSQAAVASRAPSAPARKDGPRRADSRPHPTAPVTPALRGRLGRSGGRTEHPGTRSRNPRGDTPPVPPDPSAARPFPGPARGRVASRPVPPSPRASLAGRKHGGAKGFQKSLAPVNWSEVRSEFSRWLVVTCGGNSTRHILSLSPCSATISGFWPGRELPGGPPSLG